MESSEGSIRECIGRAAGRAEGWLQAALERKLMGLPDAQAHTLAAIEWCGA